MKDLRWYTKKEPRRARTIEIVTIFILLILLCIVINNAEWIEINILDAPTPTWFPPQSLLDLQACLDTCMELNPGTLDHRDCANLCMEIYEKQERLDRKDK